MANTLTINMGNKPCYDIYITKGFDALNEQLSKISLTNKKFAIITDSQVGPIYAEKVADMLKEISTQVATFSFKAGETSKNLDTVQQIYDFLLENNFSRSDVLVALGGGVVGDITGFAASTYMRGMDFIQIPTSLLAQVDSSIGGKTGVDYKQYKNMVGAFYMPRLVYINTETLSTLDARQYYAGMAEVMKYGLIRRSNFYVWLIDNMYEIHDKDEAALEYMIGQCCQIKKEYVEKDPFDKGERAILNFGHTIGHAIEKALDFKLLHGECVALGMLPMCGKELRLRVKAVLEKLGLPTAPDADAEAVADAISHDKKFDGALVTVVKADKAGEGYFEKISGKELVEIATAFIEGAKA